MIKKKILNGSVVAAIYHLIIIWFVYKQVLWWLSAIGLMFLLLALFDVAGRKFRYINDLIPFLSLFGTITVGVLLWMRFG